jgi:hypothetical protein
MTRIITGKTTTFKFERNKPEARQQISRHADDFRKFAGERRHWESQGTVHNSGRPAMKGVPSTESKETAPPLKRKGPEMMPSESKESAPAERSGNSRMGSATSPEQQGPTKVSPRETGQNQSDKVKVRTPPVVGKQEGGSFRKGPPTRPAEESNRLR